MYDHRQSLQIRLNCMLNCEQSVRNSSLLLTSAINCDGLPRWRASFNAPSSSSSSSISSMTTSSCSAWPLISSWCAFPGEIPCIAWPSCACLSWVAGYGSRLTWTPIFFSLSRWTRWGMSLLTEVILRKAKDPVRDVYSRICEATVALEKARFKRHAKRRDKILQPSCWKVHAVATDPIACS